MKASHLFPAAFLLAFPVQAQQQPRFDYWKANRVMIERGMQALMMCNGLFTSNRTLEQVFAQELAYIDTPVGTAQSGDYLVDTARKAVQVGTEVNQPVMRSAFRTGLGCVAMARASPTRLRCPPDNCPGMRSSNSCISTRRSDSRTRVAMSASLMSRMRRSPMATLSKTVMESKSAAN